MMEKIKKIITSLMPHGPFDACAVGVIDFESACFESAEAFLSEDRVSFDVPAAGFFDLASVTKPLVNSLSYFLKPELFTQEMLLCLNHRSGILAWGLLSHDGWREQILSYPIHESQTLYSDFSALRVMLELEKKGIDQKKLCQKVWDQETVFWKDLAPGSRLLQYGYRQGVQNIGKVHDPNAWVIQSFCSHAGLFSTIGGICRTLLNYQKQTHFISQVKQDLARHSHRFSFGWDRVENPELSLAGKGHSTSTFGHLGFTGTSVWIDAEKGLGHVILTNATKEHWFDKQLLNQMRRAIGEVVWKTQVF
jgi:hypothetical protein